MIVLFEYIKLVNLVYSSLTEKASNMKTVLEYDATFSLLTIFKLCLICSIILIQFLVNELVLLV